MVQFDLRIFVSQGKKSRRRQIQLQSASEIFNLFAARQSLKAMQAPTRPRRPGNKPLPTDVLEKDETELRLEKALFGDDAGFLDSLQPRETPNDLSLARTKRPEDEDAEGDEDDDNEGLSDVVDEEVSISSRQDTSKVH